MHDQHDILIGRLVDGEATAEDRALFERLVRDNPSLQRDLDQQLAELELLGGQVDNAIAAACRVELPEAVAPTVSVMAGMPKSDSTDGVAGRIWPLVAAVSGWAAVAVMAITWWASSVPDSSPTGVLEVYSPEVRSAIERSGWGHRVLAPTVLGVEDLGDGQYRIRYLERYECIGIFDGLDGVPPVDDRGQLTTDPSESTPGA